MDTRKHQDILSRLTPEQAAIVQQMANTGTGGIENTRGPRLATFYSPTQLNKLVEAGYMTGAEKQKAVDHPKSYKNSAGNQRSWISDENTAINPMRTSSLGELIMSGPQKFLLDPDTPVVEDTTRGGRLGYAEAAPGRERNFKLGMNWEEQKNPKYRIVPGSALQTKRGIALHELQHLLQYDAYRDGEYDVPSQRQGPYSQRMNEEEATQTEFTDLVPNIAKPKAGSADAAVYQLRKMLFSNSKLRNDLAKREEQRITGINNRARK